jgi:hypothetical protein
LSVVSGGQVGEEGVEELDDRCLAVKVVGPNNSRQQDKGQGSVRGSEGVILYNNIEEAGGHRVKLSLPGAVDGEQTGTEEEREEPRHQKG